MIRGTADAPTRWSTAAFIGAALLHVDRIALWATAVLLVCAAWQIYAVERKLPPPSRPLRVLLTLMLVAAVLALFHTLNGLAAGTLLLVVMGAIKLVEARSKRDRYIVIGTALFLLLAACLDRQGLARAPLYVAATLLCCSALAVAAHGHARLPARAAVSLAAYSLLLALPVALVLFLFFPRLPGGFWALPASDAAVTGLSDSMSPGSISELTSSYEPAFRVRFAGRAPPPQERYWRGPVLHDFDGYTWRHRPGQAYPWQPLRYIGEEYRYSITLVPGLSRWWFALDTVTGSPDKHVLFSYDYTLIASEPATQLKSYDARSYTHTESVEPLPEQARRKETALPRGRNPRSRELAERLRANAGTDAGFIAAVIAHFRSGGFAYSLTPPKLDPDSVDDFLFRTRSGFCGHFASSFVALMRAGGVPARVVTGYQGGEWNPLGGYFVVRQSDAHAWAEVWLDGRGWRRIDPTAIVAPERLRRGILDLLPDALSARARFVHANAWLTQLLQGWDALNSAWNARVVNFDVNSQLTILQRLGVPGADWPALVAALGCGLIAWLAWIAWHIGRTRTPPPSDALARAYARLCAKLARAGIRREADEGPLDYAQRIARQRPDLALPARTLIRRYAQLRYGRSSGASAATALTAFARSVARARLARRT